MLPIPAPGWRTWPHLVDIGKRYKLEELIESTKNFFWIQAALNRLSHPDKKKGMLGLGSLQHRLLTSFHAEAEGVSSKTIVERLLETVKP